MSKTINSYQLPILLTISYSSLSKFQEYYYSDWFMIPEQGSIVHTLFGRITLNSRLYESNFTYRVQLRNCPNLALWESNLTTYTPHTDHSLLLPTSVKKVTQNNQLLLQLTYPLFLYQLSRQNINRSVLKDNYLETQLMYILYILVETSKQMEDLNVRLGNICPNTVLFNETGHVRVFTPLCAPNYQSLIYSKWPRPSPQQLQDPKHHVFTKSEAFSIGITLLQCGLLVDLENITKKELKQVHWQNLTRCLQDFEAKGYSKFLANLLYAMTRKDVLERATPGEILAILRPYQSQIKSMSSIDPQPQKCRQSLIQYLQKDLVRR